MNELTKFVTSKITFTEVGIIIDEGITELEWVEVLEYCEKTKEKIQWVIAELLNYGEVKKYRKYEEVMNKTNLQYKTLRNIQNVAKKVETSRRRDTLSFTHHAEVASLLPEKQNEWLNKAEVDHLSSKELREAVRKEKNGDEITERKIKINTEKRNKILIDIDHQHKFVTCHFNGKVLTIPELNTEPEDGVRMIKHYDEETNTEIEIRSQWRNINIFGLDK